MKPKTPKLYKSASLKAGLPPGTLVHIGEKKLAKTVISVFEYDQDQYRERQVQTIEESFPVKDRTSVTWVNIDGLEQIDVIEKIDAHFGIHPLVLEDIVSTEQLPKLEDYEDYLFVVLKMFYLDDRKKEIKIEQISIILGLNYVISFQETPGDIFDPIRERIRNDKGRIRKMGADYLAYCLLDSIVDHYFIVFEHLGGILDHLEEQLLKNPSVAMAQELHYLKREMIYLRRYIWPVRELVTGLLRTESKLIKKTTNIYLRDLYDHSIQVMNSIDSYRDLLAGMHDIYLSSLSQKINEVMKVLTIISAVFSPITFIVGVYGMNFKYMPELEYPWGYFIVLGVMWLISLSMLMYFKIKKWL